MGSTSSTLFNGTSRFSQDFQNLIDRATAIASLPITLLNNDKANLTDQATALTGLDGKFSALLAAVDGIGQAMGGSSFEATVSDPTKLSVTMGDGAVEGTYTIDVVDPGVYATSLTSATWTAVGSHSCKLTLDGGTTKFDVVTADTSAAGVASTINSLYGDKVHAAVVNVGSSGSPDYRISLQAVKLGAVTPDILDDGVSLQTQQDPPGAEAEYIVGNSGQPVFSASRTVTISPGVTVKLLAADAGTPVTITVVQSTSALSDALQAFATAYNAAVDELDQQHGLNAGPLAGKTVINQLSRVLSSIVTYSAAGSPLSGLASLGLDLDKTGHLSFNPFTLTSTFLASPSAVPAFLGSSATGGFLQTAMNALNGIENRVTGVLQDAQSDVQSQITSLTTELAEQQDRVDQLTQRMQEQMAAADALIASLEQQYNYLASMFQAMDTADKTYQ